MNFPKGSRGFTLIEVVVVIFLFALLTTTTTTILFTIAKNANKAKIEKELKQNGDYALNFMERVIRMGKEINPCTDAMTSLTVVNRDLTTTTFNCLDENGVSKIASTSGGITKTLTGSGATISQSGGNCTTSTLIFSCNNQSPPTVEISFTLKQPKANVRADEQASEFFQTGISLRSY